MAEVYSTCSYIVQIRYFWNRKFGQQVKDLVVLLLYLPPMVSNRSMSPYQASEKEISTSFFFLAFHKMKGEYAVLEISPVGRNMIKKKGF